MPRPSLTTLRAFEAAGRLGGFTAAARELCVTPAAVAQQVRALEAVLDRSLMVRRGRALVLTPDGRALLDGLSTGFAAIDEALSHLERRDDMTVTLSVLPSFAALWLLPRLDDLAAVLPDVALRIDATRAHARLGGGGADLAIRYAPFDASCPGAPVRLLGDRLHPVAAPALLRASPPPWTEVDFARAGLVHDDWSPRPSDWPTWSTWFEAAGMVEPAGARHVRLSQSAHVVQAATAGQGVALGHHVLVADAVRDGALAAPFGTVLESPFAYALLRGGARSGRAVGAVADWLVATCREFEASAPGR